MGLFDAFFPEVESFLDRKRAMGITTEVFHSEGADWPREENRNLVLAGDAAVELGGPDQASASFLLWTGESERVRSGRLTVIGPDLPQLSGRKVSFGKVVLLKVRGFNEDNSYQRYRELERRRYDLHLKGYMMRGVSQFMREWSRVGREALEAGFSFRTLGRALIDRYMELPWVEGAEVVFVTSGPEDVLEIRAVGERVMRVIGAMNKMAEELSFDCATCDYGDVCRDLEELRAMRRSPAGKAVGTDV